jgi:hypothetical protein
VNAPVEHSSVNSSLSNSEFPLPIFHENSKINPVSHLKQLDKFIRLKAVPKACQLAVTYRSMAGHMSRQWVETVSHNLTDYESFRKVFLNTW